jgi:D-alanyl-lipoteichoic acid acyltransferase DltB (MBOAT superfamily)
MSFTSAVFWVFLPVVLLLFHGPLRHRLQGQNLLLLLASYLFYGWWDARFLSLIVVSTATDFLVARRLDQPDLTDRQRKTALGLSFAVNLGLLGTFKYAGFFIDSWIDAWASLGVEMHRPALNIVLPVGISFYTFQTLSYTIDVYRGQLKASRNWLEFAAYVAFFPQLVAGPIERATRLLPQLQRLRPVTSSAVKIGLRLIAYGLFKKVVIADSAAGYANAAFADPSAFTGPVLVIGVIAFAFQIYGDFSGYSDIAIGLGRLFGIRLRSNFRFPYFSRNVAEFWRRWHVSLNTWFRDYLYIPLGGSRGGKWMSLRNIAIVFLISGLWHGASWNFVIWGGIHAALFVPIFLLGRNKTFGDTWHWRDGWRAVVTFFWVCLAWVFFRAENLAAAGTYLTNAKSRWGQGLGNWEAYRSFWGAPDERLFAWALGGFLLLEWALFRYGVRWPWRRGLGWVWPEALFIILTLAFSLRNEASEFIYFAF